MHKVYVYKQNAPTANLSVLQSDRDWMHENKFAYNCTPIFITNKLGFTISFDEDISFIWRGSSKQGLDSDIQILSGEKYCYFDRGGGVIGFKTGLVFKTDEDVSLLTIPVPNQFIDGAQCFTSLLSTSFYTGAFHVAWMVTKKNEVITIPAGTPICSIIPISVSQIQGSTAVYAKDQIKEIHGSDYVNAQSKFTKENQRVSDWYKKGVDQFGNTVGNHQVNSFEFIVENE